MAMHFDTSLADISNGKISGANLLQGNISLTDTPGDAGGTCLLPGFHHELLDWVKSFPPLAEDAGKTHPSREDTSLLPGCSV